MYEENGVSKEMYIVEKPSNLVITLI